MPLISVIIPVYKVESYLHRCVDSILSQTLTDFELILVDDGSPDNCGVICDEYAAKDSRIHVIHQKNGGLSAARNAGIDWAFANSDSQWLTFVDSDDWVHSELLQRLYNAASEAGVAVSVCGYVETEGEQPVIVSPKPSVQRCKPEKFYVEKNVNATVAWGKLYRKDCFCDLRYPVGKIHEDEYITYKILFDLPDIAVIDLPLYYYYQNSSGIMKSASLHERLALLDACEEQIRYFTAHGFVQAKKKRVISFGYIIQGQLKLLDKEGKNADRANKRVLKKRARRLLRKYRKEAFSPFGNNIWIYEVCYPLLMRLYWLIIAIGQRFKFDGNAKSD